MALFFLYIVVSVKTIHGVEFLLLLLAFGFSLLKFNLHWQNGINKTAVNITSTCTYAVHFMALFFLYIFLSIVVSVKTIHGVELLSLLLPFYFSLLKVQLNWHSIIN
jgi:hypothetical protein